MFKAASTTHLHKYHSDQERLTYFSHRAKSIDIPLSRYEPYIKQIAEKASQKTLHAGKFPFIAEPDAKRGQHTLLTSEPNHAVAIRARNKNWDFGDLLVSINKNAISYYYRILIIFQLTILIQKM